MDVFDSSMDLEKIRQQYDFLPYPESDITLFPVSLEQHYIHSLATPYYLRYQEFATFENKVILDAGCGSGMQALALAVANPGAKIIGVDISEKSVELAKQRFAYHNLLNGEFYAIPLEEISSLGYQFDLINCDEVLYLLSDPEAVLQLFESVLSPQGIIRANLHSYHQRVQYYRTQKLFQFVGLYDDSIENSLSIVKESIESLKSDIRMKVLYQHYINTQLLNHPPHLKEKLSDEWLLTNFLLRGDKGYTIPEVFRFLENANLDFLSMVNWRHWNVLDLFNDPDNLPLFWQLGLESASEEEKLHLYELLNPVHRLLDFWCAKKSDRPMPIPLVNWSEKEWWQSNVYLHPVLQNEKIKNDVISACQQRRPLDLSQYIKLNTTQPVIVDSSLLAYLLPLWDNGQTFIALWQRWLTIEPLALDTLEPKTQIQSFGEIQKLLTQLEVFNFILIVQGVFQEH